jgi:predicted CXXCH cytochrome family protein
MGRKAITGLALCLALLLLASRHANSTASRVDKCLECHRVTWEEAESMSFIHLPFQQKQCMRCHESRKARRERRMEEKRKVEAQVTWLGRNPAPAKVQWLNFKADPYGATVLVEAKGPGVGVRRRRLKVAPIDDLDPLPTGDGPPRISNVRVVEVERGIFLSARIAWDTDQPATSLVRYGIKALNQTSGLDSSFRNHHEVVLTGIRANRTYRFRVESESMAGKKAVGGEKEFSTAKAFRLDGDDNEAASPGAAGNEELSLKCDVFRGADDNYVLRVTASHPVAVSVGLVPDEKKGSYGESGSGAEVVKHIITSSDLFANITVCYTCHREYQKILSHPVNVYPKPGMVIPPEYPTLDDGRISCNSCHAKHASDIQFRLIKSGKKELCIGCHKDMA